MGNYIAIQSRDSKIGSFVDEPSILGAQGEVPRYRIVHSATVNKGRFGLSLGSRYRLPKFARGVKDQGSAPRQKYGVSLANAIGGVTTIPAVAS